LLKTLEEPPGHVIFVLATTDPQKVPETIRSRTQHLEFRLMSAEVLHDLLESVQQEAGLDVDADAVQAAVRRGRGSARDALSALDQVAASGSTESARPELGATLAAVGDGEVTEVLVSLSAHLAGGWGPQQLATELVDDLRQVFLAALAPELCAVSGPSRAPFTALAETMGLARVVRSMEILGRALIDMRDAPDAQVVLEIAMVRATRPDLDSGVEALAERVGALERALQGGGAPSPPASVPAAPAAAAAPAPTSGPAEAAPEPADVGRRPSLGALRRRQEGSATPDPAPAAAEPATATAAAVTPGSTSAPATGGPSVDRDSLTEVWGNGILRALSARAKALYSAGRFVSVEEGRVQFALPNAAHRDRALELAPQVEAALNAHFGSSLSLVLVIEDAKGGAPPVASAPAGAPPPPAARPAPADDADDATDEIDEDPEELMAATADPADQASAAEARLLEAFPGTSEVTP
jgi:DNA polymerase-3 subunit gamma/tau